MRQQGAVALLSGFFGALALVLAMIGLYGVTAYSVALRQGEIGLRMALGAQQTAMLCVAGPLSGITANDPATLGAAAIALTIAAAAAAFLPAWRAARLDPMRALRSE
jgi:ABC-type antimicrobial peptide transport system permease subunit